MAQMQTPAPQASSPVVDDMGFDPENMLLALINQISTKLDTDRVFDQPVSEEVAPGYHDFIKRPMCFQRMRDKVSHLVPLHGSSCAQSSHAMLFLTINLQRCHNMAELLDLSLPASAQVHGREYRTWRGFVEDFELICNNAMIYNQKRSRVHKSALAILRAGKKWLQAAELAGRKVQPASLSCIMLQDTKLCVVLFSCLVIKIPALAWNVLQFTPKQFSLLYEGMHHVFLPQQKVWLLPEPAQLRICVALRESETLFVYSSANFPAGHCHAAS